LRLSAFRFRFFFFPFVIAGLDPAIHAAAKLATCFHRHAPPRGSMDYRQSLVKRTPFCERLWPGDDDLWNSLA
jgi:hypothetical protein